MFYLMIQASSGSRGVWDGPRFVCFEASNRVEALLRAEWFGINLVEIVNGELRWEWHEPSCGKDQPVVYSTLLDSRDMPYAGGWVIVYLNGNLKCSDAVDINHEIQ